MLQLQSSTSFASPDSTAAMLRAYQLPHEIFQVSSRLFT